MAILIKRYANRKLYNTDTSRYITLKGIAKLLEQGEEVHVIDKETGEDITQIALSQILVGNQRAKEDPSETLLTQILSKGGDVLYGAIKKSVDDATEGIGDFQDRFRKIVNVPDSVLWPRREPAKGWFEGDEESETGGESDSSSSRDDSPVLSEDVELTVQRALEKALDSYALPDREDIRKLNRQLERVALAIEGLEKIYRERGDDR